MCDKTSGVIIDKYNKASKRDEAVMNSVKLKEIIAFFDSDYAPSNRYKYDLSLSENPFGHSESIVQSFEDFKEGLSHYPDKNNLKLKHAIAGIKNISEDSIYIGTGVTGIIQDLCKLYIKEGQHILLPESTFPGPIFGASIMGGHAKLVPFKSNFKVDFDAIKEYYNSNTSFVFLSNPNNPTGILERPIDIIDLANSISCPVIVSEANIEYTGESLLDFPDLPKNLIIMRSFSKVYGLASLRVGYAVAHEEIIKKVEKIMYPFRITHTSETLCLKALMDQNHVSRSIELFYEQKDFLIEELKNLGFKCIPSEGSTFIAKIPSSYSTASLLNKKLNELDCAIVPCCNFQGIGSQYVRIAPRIHETNVNFIKVLSSIL